MFLIHVLTSQRRGFCSPILVSHPSSTGNRNTASKKVPLVGTWYLYWLVVCVPLWKIWKSVGIIIPNLWKNKKMFQTTNIHQPTRSIKHNETLASWLWGLEECVVLRIACFPHVFWFLHLCPFLEKIFAVGLMSAASSLHGLMDGTRLAIWCYIQLKLDELQKNHNWHKEINDCNLGFPITGKLYDITWHPLRYVVDTGNWRIQTQGSSRNRLCARTFTFQEVASVGAPMRLMHGILLEQLSLSVS